MNYIGFNQKFITMKKYVILPVFFSFFLVQSQVQVPQASPRAQIEQTVGLTQVVLDYSRPSMRGRTIMGALVPYGALWRTGANKNTTVSFSDTVRVANQPLAAGNYALYTRPGRTHWTVYFYSDTEHWGIPQPWK